MTLAIKWNERQCGRNWSRSKKEGVNNFGLPSLLEKILIYNGLCLFKTTEYCVSSTRRGDCDIICNSSSNNSSKNEENIVEEKEKNWKTEAKEEKERKEREKKGESDESRNDYVNEEVKNVRLVSPVSLIYMESITST